MLGLGSSVSKSGKAGPSIVGDGLVLKHGYACGPVEPCSTGAVYLNEANDDYIDIGNQANLNMSTGSFSVSCWVYSNHHSTPTTRFVLGKGDNASISNSTGYALYLGNAGTDWIFSVGDGTDHKTSQTTVEANYNQWYHVCGTFDGTAKTLKLYVDGVLIDTDTDTDIGDIDNTTAFQIGRIAADTSYTWDGYICNVGVWKGVVLTQPQVKSIMHKDYASLSASEKTNLVSWWNLDETLTDTTVLDNHYGGGSYLGSELVTDGPFNNGTLSWNSNTNWTYSDGTAVSDGTDPGDTSINQSGVMEVGKTYVVSYEIISFTSGSGCRIRAGSGTTYSAARTTLGVHSFTQVCTGNTSIYVSADSSVCSIDNVSVKLVNGNTGTLS